MPGVEFVTYRGKRILYEDFSGLMPANLRDYLEKAAKLIRREPPESVLAMVNVTGGVFNVEAANMMKEFAKGNTPYMKCAVIFGLGGLQSILYRTVVAFTGRSNLIVRDNEQEARDYLADLA